MSHRYLLAAWLTCALWACEDAETDCAVCTDASTARVERVFALSLEEGAGQLTLSWELPPGATAVMLRRDADSYPSSVTDGVEVYDGPDLEFVDTDVRNFTSHYYAAYAHDGEGNFAGAAAIAAGTPMFEPVSELALSSAAGEITLTWTLPEGATGVTIRRSDGDVAADADSGETVYSGPGTVHVDDTVADYTPYDYAVFAMDAGGVVHPEARTARGMAPGFRSVAAGAHHAMAIAADGSLWAWGANSAGQLGIGATSPATCVDEFNAGASPIDCATGPVQVGDTEPWASIAAGTGHTLGRRTDGSLWAWGSNVHGELGDGTTDPSNVPRRIGEDADWKDIATGAQHCLALKQDGSLWTWGSNGWGQLGNGDTDSRPVPQAIPTGNANTWSAIAAGGTHSVALQSDGSLWTWGRNQSGEIGDGTTDDRHSPTRIGRDRDWAAVAMGSYHGVALEEDGTLWAWGAGGSGQLGAGSTEASLVPVQVGSDDDWSAVVAGGNHNLAAKSDGSLWSWGDNGSGQLGVGSRSDATSPVRIGDELWGSMAAGSHHSVAVDTGHMVWAWGWNSFGQLGTESGTSYTNPRPVP